MFDHTNANKENPPMTPTLLTRGIGGSGPPIRSRSTEILCAGESFSIVVDDTDGESAMEGGMSSLHGSSNSIVEGEGDEEQYYNKSREVKKTTEKQIAVFKTKAAQRLSELQRLLDEHDQIIRELKHSESTGSGMNYVGTSSAPFPASPNVSGHKAPHSSATSTPIKTSRTAPPSPATPQARPIPPPPTFLISDVTNLSGTADKDSDSE